MFGKPAENGAASSVPARPLASDVAKIQGKGLVQLIVTDLRPMNFYLFVNDKIIQSMDVESFGVDIQAPVDGGNPVVRASLSRYSTDINGSRVMQHTEIFPATVEIVALGRRIAISCPVSDSLDGLYISLGLKEDGTDNEVTGLQAIRVLLTDSILDAKLTWNDGESENLLPQ